MAITGDVRTSTYYWNDGTYSGNMYLRVSYSAVANESTGKYNVAFTIYAGGAYGYSYCALHNVDLGMAQARRFNTADAGISVGSNEVVVGRGSFDVDAGTYGIELYGGFIQYGTNNVSGSGEFTLPAISVKPTISHTEVSHTATTIKTRVTSSNGVSLSKYKFSIYNGNTLIGSSGEISQNNYEFTNLTPNTRYTIKAQGYGNSKWSDEVSTTITTNAQNTISNIGDFTLNGVTFTVVGNPNDTSTIKVLVNNQVVATRTNVGVGQYTLTLTQEEKNTIYNLIGNNNSIASVIRIETGTASVDYNKNITLNGDVFSCVVNVNGVVKRGKVWVGTPQGNKQGIFTIGTSQGNVRGR